MVYLTLSCKLILTQKSIIMKILSVFFVFLILISTKTINAQEKINLSAGFGTTELFNFGFRLQANQTQFVLSAGAIPGVAYSFSGDVFYHFAGKPGFSERRPWYFRAGITNVKITGDLFNWLDLGNMVFLNARIGRDFNISENIGINTDLGLRIFTEDYFTEPAFSISVFYRFNKI